jgi:hypothetical protein
MYDDSATVGLDNSASGKMMASDDKKIKTNSAPENEAPPEKKSASGAELPKADGGELAGAPPSRLVNVAETSGLDSDRQG